MSPTSAIISNQGKCLFEELSLRYTACSDKECYSNILLDGQKIGEIAFSFYDDLNAVGIGDFEIAAEYRGKGYGTKVLEFVINKYKKEFDLIYCFVDANNDGAIRLYKKLGKVFDEDGPNINNQYYVEFYNNGVNIE